MEQDSTPSSTGSNKPVVLLAGLAILALFVMLLPSTVMAAVVCAVAAALWWLASAQQDAPADATGMEAESKDEDLGLPPPRPAGLRSGAASRKQSEVSKHSPLAPAAKVAASKLPVEQQQTPAVAAASEAGEPVMMLAVNSSAAKAAVPVAAPASVTAALPAVDAVGAIGAATAASAAAAAATTATAASPAAPAAATAAGQPAALTGSAAILAKLRSQRQQSSSGQGSAGTGSRPASAQTAAAPEAAGTPSAKFTVLYASQTGTAQEIARTIHAEAAAAGLAGDCMSMNELGFDNLCAAKTPLVVVVASSTGDGDPPDNSAAAYVAMKKSWPSDRLAGVKFTVLGLGDSNYTRFMHVPRGIKSRFQDLGATCFYACAEADEVDGLEATVDPWCEGIIQPLQDALKQLAQPAAAATAAAVVADATARGSTPPSAASSRPLSGALAGEQSTALLAAVMKGGESSSSAVGDAAAAAAAGLDGGGDPRVQMELSAVSGESGLLSGGASLLGEGSTNSVAAAAVAETAAAAEAATTATALAAAAAAAAPRDTASSRRSTASARSDAGPVVKLVNGLAPAGVDLKGVPPLVPCRITLSQQVSLSVAAAAREREAAPTMEQKFHRDPSGNYSAAAPFWATVSDARLMTAESSDRTVIHVELDVADSGMRFNAGDAVGVLPQNAAPLVSGLLARLGLDGDTVFEVQPASGEATGQGLLSHVPWPCSLRYAFTNCTDLTSVPRKSLLRLLAEHCSDADEQHTLLFLASKAGREAYGEEITRGQPSLLDLLRRFPSCNPPLDALLDALPPMAPRMYSLTNAPVPGPAASPADAGSVAAAAAAAAKGVPGAVGPNKLQFALSVVEFETQYGTRHGVATNWLARAVRPWLAGEIGPGTDPVALPQVWVPLFLRRAADFRPPRSLSTPMVMIGPGTGVAPFRGFLQQRLADVQAAGGTTPATAVLYFGCRKADEDYLYEQDWAALTDAGALQSLRVAFSRAQASKVYVQHLIKEDSRSVAKLIAEGAHVYVCGDGAAMAKDVHATLLALLRAEMGLSESQAAEELTAMAKAGRYVRDIWS